MLAQVVSHLGRVLLVSLAVNVGCHALGGRASAATIEICIPHSYGFWDSHFVDECVEVDSRRSGDRIEVSQDYYETGYSDYGYGYTFWRNFDLWGWFNIDGTDLSINVLQSYEDTEYDWYRKKIHIDPDWIHYESLYDYGSLHESWIPTSENLRISIRGTGNTYYPGPIPTPLPASMMLYLTAIMVLVVKPRQKSVDLLRLKPFITLRFLTS